jgi:FKBP-type peptidyl-prolyl cis-trans isomerase
MKSKILILLVICLATGSCVKEKLETFYSKQDTQIDAYMTKARVVKRDSIKLEITPNADDPTKNDTTKVKVEWEDSLDVIYNKGAVRLVKTEGTGPALEEGGAVSFYYAGYVFTSNPSSLFATNHQETAAGAGFILTDDDYQIFEADMRSTQLLEGVRNGLIGVKSGEVCEIAFSGKYGFGDEVFGTIPVNSALLYKIWVLGVSNE